MFAFSEAAKHEIGVANFLAKCVVGGADAKALKIFGAEAFDG